MDPSSVPQIPSSDKKSKEKKSLTISLDPPAGTRDFAPPDMRIRNWLFDIWRDISKKFGFSEYDCPVVEYSDLYVRKGGDDILQEMFAFELGSNKLALRPEMTPSLCRLYMSNPMVEPSPQKFFSIPQCWRYEDIKRGRKREHFQWNNDIIGAEKIISEVELFMMIATFFQRIGLTPNDVQLRVSNRMILQKVLTQMGVANDLFERACVIIDKIAKKSRDEMSVMLRGEIGLTEDQISTIYDLCATKDINLISKFLGENDETYLEMCQIFKMADEVGIGKWLTCDVSVVRGLSYYSGVVFEGFSVGIPELQKSICGGGRYDNLCSSYGFGKCVPMCGYGFGDLVICELLKDLGKLPKLKTDTKFLIVSHNSALMGEAMKLSQQMRDIGVCTETYTGSPRIKHAYDFANKKEIENVILIAPEEFKNGQIVWKKMNEDKNSSTKQQTMDISEFLKML